MKKAFGITIAVLMAVLVFGIAGLVYAQDTTPTQPVPGQGMLDQNQMGGGRRAGQGGMGGGMQAGATGLWHEAVIASLAEAFGMTPETLQARLDAGETIWQVAEGLGWTSEQLQAKMIEARGTALQQAVADGLLTQAQADLMAQRMNQGWAEGFGPGSANCDGTGQAQGRHGGRGFGMRGQNQPTP
jgi:hypothetical protein